MRLIGIWDVTKLLVNVLGNSTSASHSDNLAYNTVSETEIDVVHSAREEPCEIEREMGSNELSDEQRDKVLSIMEAEDLDPLIAMYQQRINHIEKSDPGKLCLEIIAHYEEYKNMSSELLADYIEKLEKTERIEEHEAFIKELKRLLEESKVVDGRSETSWRNIFRPSTSGTVRAPRPPIELLRHAFKMMSENIALKDIGKDIISHVSDEGLDKLKEWVHSQQTSSFSPEQMQQLQGMQALYDGCPK